MFYILTRSYTGMLLKLSAPTVDECLSIAARYPSNHYRVYSHYTDEIVYEVK